MSKKTDYKKLWKKTKDKKIVLENQIKVNLVPRLMRAEQVLLGIVMGEVDVDALAEDYAKNNPNMKVKTNKKGKKYVVKDNPKPKPASDTDKK